MTREVYGEEDELEDLEEVGIAIPSHDGHPRYSLHRLRPYHLRAAAALRIHRQVRAADSCAQSASWRCPRPQAGFCCSVLILSGLAALIAMTRAGIRAFWASPDRTVPRVRLIEMAPVVVLLLLCAIQTIQAGPVMRFMQATAQSLHAPQDYIRGVLGPAGNRPNAPGGPT